METYNERKLIVINYRKRICLSREILMAFFKGNCSFIGDKISHRHTQTYTDKLTLDIPTCQELLNRVINDHRSMINVSAPPLA